nr:hypothetical protein BCU64_18400 [Vibrio lentus]
MRNFNYLGKSAEGDDEYECPNPSCKEKVRSALLTPVTSCDRGCELQADCYYCDQPACLEPKSSIGPRQKNTPMTNPDSEMIEELSNEIDELPQSDPEGGLRRSRKLKRN